MFPRGGASSDWQIGRMRRFCFPEIARPERHLPLDELPLVRRIARSGRDGETRSCRSQSCGSTASTVDSDPHSPESPSSSREASCSRSPSSWQAPSSVRAACPVSQARRTAGGNAAPPAASAAAPRKGTRHAVTCLFRSPVSITAGGVLPSAGRWCVFRGRARRGDRKALSVPRGQLEADKHTASPLAREASDC